MGEGSVANQYFASIVVNLATFTFGTVVAWTSPSLPVLMSPETPLDEPLTIEEASWVGALVALGGIIGAPLFGYLADILGRKTCASLIGLTHIINWICIIIATSSRHMYIGRLFAGIGNGGTSVIIPMFVVEIAEVRIRGSLGTIFVVNTNLGILSVYIMGTFMSYYTLCYVLLSIPVLFLVCLMFLPETPIYLLKKNKTEQAAASMLWYRGMSKQSENEDVKLEMENLQVSVKSREVGMDESRLTKFKDLFRGANGRGLLIGCVLGTTSQMSGIAAILSYAANIFKETGGAMSPNVSAIVMGSVRLVGTLVATLLVERTGRKLLLLVSSTGAVICLSTLGAFSYAQSTGMDVSSMNWIPVTSLSLFLVSFSLGLGPVTFVVISEVFSARMRSTGCSVSMLVLMIASFLVAKFFSNMVLAVGLYGCVWFFSGCVIAGALFVYFYVPETKGRHLDDILEELGGKDMTMGPFEIAAANNVRHKTSVTWLGSLQ